MECGSKIMTLALTDGTDFAMRRWRAHQGTSDGNQGIGAGGADEDIC